MGIIRRRASHREPALPPIIPVQSTWQHVLQGTPYGDRPLVEKPSIICSLAHQGPKYSMYADAGVLRNVTDVFLPYMSVPTYRPPACPGNLCASLGLFSALFSIQVSSNLASCIRGIVGPNLSSAESLSAPALRRSLLLPPRDHDDGFISTSTL